MMLKPLCSIFAAAILLTATTLGTVKEARAMMLDRVLVVVNDDIITYGEFESALKTMRKQLQTVNEQIPSEQVLKEKVLEQLVFEKLIQLHAVETGIKITDVMLETAIENLAKQNNMTVAQVFKQINQDGMSESEFKKQLSEQLLVQQVIDRDVKRSITVLDSEVDGVLRNISKAQPNRVYDISNIQLVINENLSPILQQVDRQRAEKLRQRILNGEISFAKAARNYSQAGNAGDGGAMGWKSEDQLPALFADALKDMKAGDISQPLISPGGIHLLKLNQVKGNKQQFVEQIRARHILLKASNKIDIQHAVSEMKKVRQRIISGEDFAVLATELSQDTGSAIKGGELGWMGKGETVPAFEKAMNALAANEISQPVVSQFGVHLIQLQERRKVDVSEEQRRNAIRQQIGKRKVAEKYDQFLKQLKLRAYIDYRTPLDEI